MTERTALRGRERPRPPTRSRRRSPWITRQVRPLLAIAALGGALVVALLLGSLVAPAVPQTDDGERLQTLWRDPLPPFLTSALNPRGTASGQRGLITPDPPRVLGVPAVPAGAAGPRVAGGGVPIQVFFSRRPESDSARPAVFPLARVAPDRAVATAALASLIAGPTTAERANGYFSELGTALTGPSSCSGRDFRIAITNGVATVQFCRSIAPAGAGRDARLRSQIEATLRQFPTIARVRLIGTSGRRLFD